MTRPRPVEPRLQRKLLAWLLGPLFILLVLDTAAAYWTSLRFSHVAYDRALHEIAREIVLHVKPGEPRPRLELTDSAEKVLLLDQDDRLYYRLAAQDGTRLGGDGDLPAPGADLPRNGQPHFYGATLHGHEVRMVAAWMPIAETPNHTTAVAATISSSWGSTTLATISQASRVRLLTVSATCTCTSGAPGASAIGIQAATMRTGWPCRVAP